MSDLCVSMTREQLLEVCHRHKDLFADLSNMDWTADEVFSFLDFASDFLDAESKAVREKEPYATKAIDRYERAGYELYSMGDDCYELLRGEEV